MYYAGIDYHKRYSVVSIQDDAGAIVLERRIEHNDPFAFSEVVQALPGRVKVVYECGQSRGQALKDRRCRPNPIIVGTGEPVEGSARRK